MKQKNCYCGSEIFFENCCEPYIKNKKKCTSALSLMRSRYSAYVTCEIDYLVETTAPSERKYYSKKDMLEWASENKWQKLEIIDFSEFTVEFKAYFLDKSSKLQIHHEKSTFVKENDNWYYQDGIFNDDIA
ncbi:MAG: YchJ family protein [Flavobacterium sp.]